MIENFGLVAILTKERKAPRRGMKASGGAKRHAIRSRRDLLSSVSDYPTAC
jgi:hypothetical protein